MSRHFSSHNGKCFRSNQMIVWESHRTKELSNNGDAATSVCETVSYAYGESCYFFMSTSANYKEAAAECESTWNAHLVFIESEEEQQFLVSQILLLDNQADFWIGLIKSSLGLKTWSDGREHQYINFEYSSFNEGTPCFRMKSNSNYVWHDRQCSFTFSYICEQENACLTPVDSSSNDSLTSTLTNEKESSTESSTEDTTEPPIEEESPTIKKQAGESRSSYVRSMADNLSLPDATVLSRFQVNSIIRCAGLCNELLECTHFTHMMASSTCLLGDGRDLQLEGLVPMKGARSFSVSSDS
ncbi:uncharacterized protein LOC129255132 [Lytechinus pictus]|uniref:uncharacterized protein LOC129255132 n=1 Tax=Lytechinus pictus TaxID=7653 RepID=UPI0030B9B482